MDEPVPDSLPDAQAAAFAELTEIGQLVAADRVGDATAVAERLGERIAARPTDPALAGFATMGLDAALWLLAGGADAAALSLCETVIARCVSGEDERPAAAGARFLAAQAAARLGRDGDARGHLTALTAMGEPALAALHRLTERLAAAGADAAWHAQLAAASVTVLWRLGRVAEARVIAGEAAAAFQRAGRPDLAARLSALEREIGPS